MTRLLAAAVLAAIVIAAPAWGAAKIILINADGPNEGLNDPSPRQPVGGNPGDTLGEQRRYALLFAAQLVASRITTSVPIRVKVEFNPLECDANSAQIGGAAPIQLFSFNTNPPPRALPNVLYPAALANALTGRDLSPDVPAIGAVFNSAVDNNSTLGSVVSPCLGDTDWYYGFDHQSGNDLNFVSTAVHELIHGLGFVSFTNLRTGEFLHGTPDIYSYFILDQAVGATWPHLTAAQRAESATNAPMVVWAGAHTTSSGVPDLSSGTRIGRVRLYAPDPLEPGSSISHWTPAVFPNDLMEPFVTGDTIASNGIGLASCVLFDMGWRMASGVGCPDWGSAGLNGGTACFAGGRCGIPESDGNTGDNTGGSNGGGGTGGSNSNGGGFLGGFLDDLFGGGGETGGSSGDTNSGGTPNTGGDSGGTGDDAKPSTPPNGNDGGAGTAPAGDTTNSAANTGGGGCTLGSGGSPDPVWLLILAAAWGLRQRSVVDRRASRPFRAGTRRR